MTSRRPGVLVVDDLPDNIAVLANVLAPCYRVRAATTGSHALAICRSADPPGLLLLDVVMPGIDGYEVCRQLKESPATAQIPVIFVTGNARVEDEERCLALGGVDCLAKPIRVALLLRRVETQLELLAARRLIAKLMAG